MVSFLVYTWRKLPNYFLRVIFSLFCRECTEDSHIQRAHELHESSTYLCYSPWCCGLHTTAAGKASSYTSFLQQQNNIFWELNCYGTFAFPLTFHHFIWQEKPPENNTMVWVWFIWDYQSNARFILTDTQNRTRRPVGDYKCVEDRVIPTFIWTQHAVMSFSGPSMVSKSTLLQWLLCSLLAQGLFTPRQCENLML